MSLFANFLKKISIPTLTFVFGIVLATAITQVMAHGGNASLIHGCVKTSNGSISIIGANETCNGNETALDWSKQAGNNGLPLSCLRCGYVTVDNINVWANFLKGKDLTGAMLPQNGFGNEVGSVDMSSTNFINAYLGNSSFHNSNLTNSNFTNAIILDSDFTGANLTGVNFTGANLTGAGSMDTATITGVIWSNTICPDGTNSDNNGNTCSGHLTP